MSTTGPGVSYNDKVLDGHENNFLAAVHFGDKKNGVAFLDVSTGEFLVAEGNAEHIDKLIQGFQPKEILFQKGKQKNYTETISGNAYTYKLEDWIFTNDFALENLQKHFEVKALKGFGVDSMTNAVVAASAVLHYLSDTQHDKLGHIKNISRIEEDNYVWLNRFTVRNLELLHSPNENATTLIQVLDQTITPPGSPNIDIYDPKSALLLYPWGKQMSQIVLGGNHNHVVYDTMAQKYWNAVYHSNGIFAVKSLINTYMNENTFSKIKIPIFMGYYYKDDENQDNVVSVSRMLEFFEQVSTPEVLKQKVAFPQAGNHGISSYIMSKDIDNIRNKTFEFGDKVLGLKPVR